MIIKYAQGFSQQSNVVAFPYEPTLTQPIEWDIEYAASGLGVAVAGGTMRLAYSAIDIEETEALLSFLGIDELTPSAACTLLVRNLSGIHYFYNGYVSLVNPRGGAAWWQDLEFEFSALERL